MTLHYYVGVVSYVVRTFASKQATVKIAYYLTMYTTNRHDVDTIHGLFVRKVVDGGRCVRWVDAKWIIHWFIERVDLSIYDSLREYSVTYPHADMTDIAFKAQLLLATQKSFWIQPAFNGNAALPKHFASTILEKIG